MTTGRALPRWAGITLAVYAGAFPVGTVSHLLDFALQGVPAALARSRLYFS